MPVPLCIGHHRSDRVRLVDSLRRSRVGGGWASGARLSAAAAAVCPCVSIDLSVLLSLLLDGQLCLLSICTALTAAAILTALALRVLRHGERRGGWLGEWRSGGGGEVVGSAAQSKSMEDTQSVAARFSLLPHPHSPPHGRRSKQTSRTKMSLKKKMRGIEAGCGEANPAETLTTQPHNRRQRAAAAQE